MSVTIDRRALLITSAAAGAGATLLSVHRATLAQSATPSPPPVADGPFRLPDLPYPYDALEPHIDTMTMQIHHDKHHAAYVNNLNTALSGHPDLHSKTIEDLLANLDILPESIQTAVRNNGGGHANHSWFWHLMSSEGGAPAAELSAAVDRDLGGMEAMQSAINDAGLKRFGSGWAWLVSNGGTLSIVSTPNQDNPVLDGSGTPILGIDVWEHAYYLMYQNRRTDYLAAWWNVVNWATVSERYAATAG